MKYENKMLVDVGEPNSNLILDKDGNMTANNMGSRIVHFTKVTE